MKKYINIILLSICLLSFSCKNSSNTIDLRDDKMSDIKRAKIILKNTDVVTSNKIYEGGIYSITAWAFSILFEDAKQNGNANFVDVFNESKYTEGRIYALTGLYWIDKKKYSEMPKGFTWRHYTSLFYCLKSKESYREFLKNKIVTKNWLDSLIICPNPSFLELNNENSNIESMVDSAGLLHIDID